MIRPGRGLGAKVGHSNWDRRSRPSPPAIADDGEVAVRPESPASRSEESKLPSLLSGAGSLAASFAGADPVADEERRRGLRRMKLVALSFLIGATLIFLACAWAQKGG